VESIQRERIAVGLVTKYPVEKLQVPEDVCRGWQRQLSAVLKP
jgi:hypothetical protein